MTGLIDTRMRVLATVSVVAVLVAVQAAARLLDLGALDDAVAGWSYALLMGGAAAAAVARVVVEPRQRLAWALIAMGLACWALGDLVYWLDGDRLDATSGVLYFLRYIAFLGGLRILRGKPPMSPALAIVLLALATLWSWVVFGDVVAGAGSGDVAVAFTVAYSLLDLVLLAGVLLTLAARGWRFDWPLAALAGGFVLLAVADSLYAHQIAAGTYRDGTALAALWPAAALCVAAGVVFGSRHPWGRDPGDRDLSGLVLVAIVAAIGVQLFDHFSPVHTITFLLSAATLVASVVQRVTLNRDRRQAHAATVAAEALHVASAEAALDCIISMDGEGRVCEWNEAARRTFGYSLEDARGCELADLIIPPEHRDRHREGLRRVVAGGHGRILGKPIDVMAMRADGGEFPVELTVTQVRTDPPLFTGFVRDATELRRREEENARLAAIVRSTEDAILSKDRNGVLTAWNPGAEQLYGYSAAEAIGKPLTSLIVPPEGFEEVAAFTKAAMSGESAAIETQRRRKDGALIHVSLRAFPIHNLAGEIVGVSTIAHDITERLRREEQERKDEEGRLWRGRVQTALSEGHLMFWGQPVLDARTGHVHHHELLLRMDLDGDVITPNRFLPHAEDSDLITDIDRWAITEGIDFACTQRVAINLSAKSLQRPELIDDIKRA
ncbi:MAG: hypothetical protein QOJ57_2491, partial [Thermoleophilaceae bacterium]|nr:hypothetical protein [Thermoleophilaceae bacterium]